MKKYTSTTLSVFIAFVIFSSLSSFNGGAYSQQNTTQTQTNATESANATAGQVVRDSATVLLGGETLPAESFIHLYDSTPYKIVSGHVAANLPCNSDNATNVNVLVGVAPNVSSTELEYVPELSNSGQQCLYHVDLASDATNTITDIAIQNNSTEDIEFPATSTVVIGVNEISKISDEGHGH